MIQSHVTKTASDASTPLYVCRYVRTYVRRYVCMYIGSESENERSRAKERRGSASVNVNANSNTAVIIMPAPWRLNVSSITVPASFPLFVSEPHSGPDRQFTRHFQITHERRHNEICRQYFVRNISQNITITYCRNNRQARYKQKRWTTRCISCTFNPSSVLILLF